MFVVATRQECLQSMNMFKTSVLLIIEYGKSKT